MRLASVARGERVTGYRLEKSLRLCLAGLRIRGLDPIAKTSELPDHSRRAPLFRLFGDGWAAFFVSGQRRWVGFPVSERLQHPPGTEAEQIGDEAGQLDRTF